jgi:hypothetical protein
LRGDVEWTDERERHIADRHPDLLPAHLDRVAETLADPDAVYRSERFGPARLFTRWHPIVGGGKHVVVVVVTENTPMVRHWIITAYLARHLAGRNLEWTRS